MAHLQEIGPVVRGRRETGGIGQGPTPKARRFTTSGIAIEAARVGGHEIWVTAVSLQLQMEAQCVVELCHDVRWGPPENRA